MPDIIAALEAVRYEAAYRTLAEFTRQAWPIIEPDTPLLWAPHLDLLCEALECITLGEPPHSAFASEHGMAAGERITALAINIPPRYMKSTIVSVMWPCWEWARRPETRGLYSSYSERLSTHHSLTRRRILESAWYRRGMELWGTPWELTGDQNVKTYYENTRRGAMMSTSTGGSAVGAGGDRVVVDDPTNPTEALSDARRETANRFFDETLSTRLNDKHSGAFVIVMQRLHQDDLTGHVLEQSGWVHLALPALSVGEQRSVFPRSGRVWVRADGEVLWPEREGADEIATAQARLGPYGFAGQYQQSPTPLGGGIIKREWFRFWTHAPRPDDDESVVILPASLSSHMQSWDTTYWEAVTSDWCVGQVWARSGANCYLLDQSRAKRDLDGLKGALRALTARWPQATAKVIERTANGSEILRKMRDEIPGLIGVSVKTSKEARVLEVVPLLIAGNVILPHPREADWVEAFIDECMRFPYGTHDDQVDAMSQALTHMDHAVGVPAAGGLYPSAQRAAASDPRGQSGPAFAGGRGFRQTAGR